MTRVVIISDLHCGSIFGLMPPSVVTSDGAVRGQTKAQEHLWDCWKRMCQALKGKFDCVIVNGDVIDGTQRAQRGTELALPILADQTRAAESVLLELKAASPKAKWYFTQGTEYHDQKAGREVEILAQNLGGQKYAGDGIGVYSHEVLNLDIEGVLINAAHHISSTTGLYRAVAIDREALWSAIAGKDGKALKADVVVRSHVHYCVHVEHPSKHAIITPCWQVQTRFMRRSSVYRSLPDIGAVVLEIDGKAKRRGEDPVRFFKILYPLPVAPAEKF